MNKKNKLLLIICCIVTVVIGIGILIAKNSNTATTASTSTGESQDILNEVVPEEEISQFESAEPAGVSFSEFESSLKDLGYLFFDEGCYDLISNNKSLAFVQISEDDITISLNSKSDIKNDAIVSAIKLLIPNESQQIFDHITNNTDSISMSLDNRTVSISLQDDKVNIGISKSNII